MSSGHLAEEPYVRNNTWKCISETKDNKTKKNDDFRVAKVEGKRRKKIR